MGAAGIHEETEPAEAVASILNGVVRAIDVLVVDEAGQMSLANVLACAQSAQNLVLLGDPQQLEQPQKAAHPEGSELSALEYLARRSRDNAGGARALSRGNLAPSPVHLQLHVRAVLRGEARFC
jgi:hypothetical protein